MKQTRSLMGMAVTLEVVAERVPTPLFERVFAYFNYVDETFSVYKETSEISAINQGRLSVAQASADMQTVFALADMTRQQTDGFFDIVHDGRYDPSGLVKGWAIHNAAELVRQAGFHDFYVMAGGDFEAAGTNAAGQLWQVGIQNPFNFREIVKVLRISDRGVATSGTYLLGQHIYNPRQPGPLVDDIVSLTVIGPNVYDADRFATAAFAMGRAGIGFIEHLDNFEGYMIDTRGRATLTSGFSRYTS